jgi:hypothetical protein
MPPFAAYDSLNFVPESQDLGRLRGGSRPGMMRLFKTSASTPIQCIETVNLKESSEAFKFFADSLEFDAFSSSWVTTASPIGGVTSVAPTVANKQFHGSKGDAVEQKVIYRVAPTDWKSPATSDSYMLGMYIVPYANAHHGDYSIYLRLDGTPSVSGDATAMEARLSITGAGTVSVQLYKQAVALGSAFTATDSVATEGWFEVKVTKGGTNDTFEVFWRGESLGTNSTSTGTATDRNFGFGLKATVASGRVVVDRVRLQYTKSSAFEMLRPRTVFIQGGQVFRETTYFQKFTASASNLRCASDRPLVAAERGGKLYIADNGEPIGVGTDGVFTTNNTFDSATYSDWTTILSASTGTDAYFGNFVVHVLGFTALATASDGAITSTGTGITFDSATYADWTTVLSSSPTAANYYGNYQLTISSGGENFGTYAITAVAAGNITLATTGKGAGVTGSGMSFRIGRATTRGMFPISALASGSLTVTGNPPNDTSLTFRIERGPKVYDPLSDSLTLWTATTDRGMVPVGCKSVARYRDRLVLAVDPLDPNEYYMSRLGDPSDWLFTDDDVGAALKGSNSDAGRVGEPITAIMPYSDDHIFFGCRAATWIMRGDPAGGGRVDLVSGTVGVVGLKSWCQGPKGEVIWLSRDGVYQTNPECLTCEPVSLSREKLPRELIDLNGDFVPISMAYDVRQRGFFIFLAPTETTVGVKQWFYDWTTKGFFPLSMSTASYPAAVKYLNAVDPDDSSLLLGGNGGSIRRFSWTAANDDDAAITSYVLIGPLSLGVNDGNDGILQSIDATLPANQGSVTWSIYVGVTTEEAVTSSSVFATGTWTAGGQNTVVPMARGGAFALKLAGVAGYRWGFESASTVERSLGKQRV